MISYYKQNIDSSSYQNEKKKERNILDLATRGVITNSDTLSIITTPTWPKMPRRYVERMLELVKLN